MSTDFNELMKDRNWSSGHEYYFEKCCFELAALEERAGIGSGRDLSNGRDLWRDTRELYFGVGNLALRKELVRKHRECVSAYYGVLGSQISVAKGTLKFLKDRGNVSVWLGSGVAAIIPIVVGTAYFEIPGAIGGAVFGCFIGMAVKSAWIANRKAEIKQAKENLLKEVDYAKDERLIHWHSFGFLEENGVRDESCDR